MLNSNMRAQGHCIEHRQLGTGTVPGTQAPRRKSTGTLHGTHASKHRTMLWNTCIG